MIKCVGARLDFTKNYGSQEEMVWNVYQISYEFSIEPRGKCKREKADTEDQSSDYGNIKNGSLPFIKNTFVVAGIARTKRQTCGSLDDGVGSEEKNI